VTLYTVYEPPGEARDLQDQADKLAFIKEGFSWPALFVPGLWLLYQRMWIELIAFLFFFAGTAVGPVRDAAELAFFQSWLPRQEKGRQPVPVSVRAGNADLPAPKTSGEAEGVIGLFPQP